MTKRRLKRLTYKYMEHFFLNILQQVASEMPQLSLVDEDCGQLESNDDGYPITFPCVLLGNIEAEWTDLGLGAQKGRCTLTARLAIDCYDDTHMGSGTEEKIAERQRMATHLYRALHGFVPGDASGPLTRLNSRDFTLPRGIKVYEQTYIFEYHDESARA